MASPNNSPVLNPFSIDGMMDEIAAMLKQRLAELDRARLQLMDVLEQIGTPTPEAPATAPDVPAEKPRRRMSARARAAISKAQKAVWARRRRQG